MIVGTIIAYAATLIQSYTTRNVQAQILENIRSIDNIFQFNLCMEPQHKRETRNLNRHLLINFIITTITSILYAFSCTWTKPYLFVSYIATFTKYVYELKCIQLEVYLKMIDHRMKLMITYFSKNMKSDKTDSWTQEFSSVIKIRSSRVERLITLKIIYSKLWRVSIMLNDCFGWSLLIIVVIKFISLTTNAYWLVLNIINSDKTTYMTWYGKSFNNGFSNSIGLSLKYFRKLFADCFHSVYFIVIDELNR